METYYDCLQCTDHCYHSTLNTGTNVNSICNNNNNNQDPVRLKNARNSLPEVSSLSIKDEQLKHLFHQELLNRSNLAKAFRGQIELTPARKRSSLARPVRVHDSFQQQKGLVGPGFVLQRPSLDLFDEDERADVETGWSIRLRLEQMLELTLPQSRRKRKKAGMMLMQHQRVRNGFKDTERLLKVFSINNVDQDTRYNVDRCAVM
ncbi:uncharacterized protein [Prorops nasuta]|uniref:uncharacterized protein n=1 Tax=Prorops nasuta TaxID=863751 RepID=UPI0034CD6BFC